MGKYLWLSSSLGPHSSKEFPFLIFRKVGKIPSISRLGHDQFVVFRIKEKWYRYASSVNDYLDYRTTFYLFNLSDFSRNSFSASILNIQLIGKMRVQCGSLLSHFTRNGSGKSFEEWFSNIFSFWSYQIFRCLKLALIFTSYRKLVGLDVIYFSLFSFLAKGLRVQEY